MILRRLILSILTITAFSVSSEEGHLEGHGEHGVGNGRLLPRVKPLEVMGRYDAHVAVNPGRRGGTTNQTAPLFIKLYKVGSTLMSSLLECSKYAVHSQTRILGCLQRTNHPFSYTGQFGGLWDHHQMIQLGLRGTEVLLSPCFQLVLAGQRHSLFRPHLPHLKV